MENQNVNQTNDDLSKFRESFSEYQKNQTKKSKKTKEEILSKYFTPRNTNEIFRILPYKTKHFYSEAFFHVADAMTAGGKKKLGGLKIYCPAHNDPKVNKLDANGDPILDGNGNPIMVPAPCPLCDKAKKLLAKQDTSIKFIKKADMNDDQLKISEYNKKVFLEANKWEAKKFYIIRGIDKGKPVDGVKFWRFKHSFQNQGVLDKLFPVLEAFQSMNNVTFYDAQNGADLQITMAESKTNSGVPYKSVSAIIARGKSPLSEDPIVARQWLEDNITWRDIFIPKVAPNMTAYEYMEMVASGTNPYWDDSDTNNKHWVFPGRPDLEELANTRKANLDADDENFEQASDLDDEPRVTISNVTPNSVGTYKENAVDITAKPAPAKQVVASTPVVQVATANVEVDPDLESGDVDDGGDYNDLPF